MIQLNYLNCMFKACMLLWLLGRITSLSAQPPDIPIVSYQNSEKEAAVKIDPLKNQSVERIYKLSNPFLELEKEEKKEIILQNHLQVLREIYRVTCKAFLIQSQTKVKFRSGNFRLNPWNQTHLEHLVGQIKEQINQHRIYFPDEKVNLLIEIRGYSDETPFYQGQPEAERKEQNLLLSQKRAEEVLLYIKNHTERYVDKLEIACLAYGEELPYYFCDSQEQDEDRRVCDVYCLLFNERRYLPTKIRF